MVFSPPPSASLWPAKYIQIRCQWSHRRRCRIGRNPPQNSDRQSELLQWPFPGPYRHVVSFLVIGSNRKTIVRVLRVRQHQIADRMPRKNFHKNNSRQIRFRRFRHIRPGWANWKNRFGHLPSWNQITESARMTRNFLPDGNGLCRAFNSRGDSR